MDIDEITLEEFKDKIDSIVDYFLVMGQMDYYETKLRYATVDDVIATYDLIYNSPRSIEEYISQEADCIH